MTRLDLEAVRTAYRRQAPSYDYVFGLVSRAARERAVAAVNDLPGTRVLEVGVGTGLALPYYAADKRVTGIDLSAEMLARARDRVAKQGLAHVEALLERNAEATDFPAAGFDIAACMFVASVVPNPRALLAELRRVVRPGGHILFVTHFLAASGPRRAIEQGLAPLSRALGWHPDFAVSDLFGQENPPGVDFSPVPPAGIFTLVHVPR
jgi:phosphatidylethanolamine/phosphatidyl-N-methylethanolamine N-methyltransferase